MATGKLQEVEEDAIYIQNKRFADQREEFAREQEKLAKKTGKTVKAVETVQTFKTGGETYTPETEKGK